MICQMYNWQLCGLYEDLRQRKTSEIPYELYKLGDKQNEILKILILRKIKLGHRSMKHSQSFWFQHSSDLS